MDKFGLVVDEGVINGARCVVVKFDGVVVMPYVRQTWRSRFRKDRWGVRARDYNDMRASFRDALMYKMRETGMQDFGKARLGFSGMFWLKNVGRVDLDNLVKAALDVCGGVLFPNDNCVYVIERCEKNRGRPAMVLKFWEVS